MTNEPKPVKHVDQPMDGGKLPEDAIGRALKRVYSSLVEEPLPDRFQKLLKDLEQSGPKK
jgi:hypothetical protein